MMTWVLPWHGKMGPGAAWPARPPIVQKRSTPAPWGFFIVLLSGCGPFSQYANTLFFLFSFSLFRTSCPLVLISKWMVPLQSQEQKYFEEHWITITFFFFFIFTSVFKLLLNLKSSFCPFKNNNKLLFFQNLFLVLILNNTSYLDKNLKFLKEKKLIRS